MIKNLRYIVLLVVLIGALTLSACSAVLPTATSLANRYILDQRTAAAASAAADLPAGRPAATALAAGDLEGRLQEIYNAANPSVVNIRVVVQPNVSLGGRSVPGAPVAQGEGSGFVWDRQGHIVTNSHVVAGARKITVTFADGAVVPATVVGTDPDSDLAVIKVDPATVKLQPVTVGDSTQVKVGQFVVAIGNPFGLEGSMTFGIVSALGRTLPAGGESAMTGQAASYTIPDIIQTDAPVNPGNSGGVLLDLNGNLIGVPSAIESPVPASSGVGFAIPSAIVKRVVPELIQNGKFEHPWIGISGTTLSSEVAQEMGLAPTQRGALVVDVVKDSPADKAGLIGSTRQATIEGVQIRVGGDVITAVEGQPIKRFEDLVTYLARNGKVGQTIRLAILRDGKETTVSLTLAARPTTPQARTQARGDQRDQGQAPLPAPRGNAPAGRVAWLGVAGIDLTPEVAKAMSLDADQTGALIQEVTAGSPAEKAGLRAGTQDFQLGGRNIKVGGDVIIGADGKDVTSMQDLAQIVRSKKPGDRLELTVLRDGKQLKITVELAARPTN
ncbi:MAG: trypsin-like peptidase domain-containing protein [Anaerolineae bacterium]